MPLTTPPVIAESADSRKAEPVQFQALSATVGLLSEDRARVLVTFGTHCRQRVGIRVSRKVMIQVAAEVARLEGLSLVRASAPATGSVQA